MLASIVSIITVVLAVVVSVLSQSHIVVDVAIVMLASCGSFSGTSCAARPNLAPSALYQVNLVGLSFRAGFSFLLDVEKALERFPPTQTSPTPTSSSQGLLTNLRFYTLSWLRSQICRHSQASLSPLPSDRHVSSCLLPVWGLRLRLYQYLWHKNPSSRTRFSGVTSLEGEHPVDNVRENSGIAQRHGHECGFHVHQHGIYFYKLGCPTSCH